MIAGNCDQAAGERVFGAMGKYEARARGQLPGPLLVGQQPIEGNAAQANNHTQVLEQGNLLVEPRGAIAQLLGRGLVGWGSATADGGNPKILELHAVVAR